MANLIDIIKKTAVDAVNASKPVDIVVGDVVSTAPLKVRIGQKIILDEDFLIPTAGFRQQTLEGDAEIDGRVTPLKLTVENTVDIGDQLLLIRAFSGTDYIILDRLVRV